MSITHYPPRSGGVTDHGGLTGLADDDHTQYQKESEKGVASGYASLDSGVLVPTAQLGSGTPSSSTFLRGDRTWASAGGTFSLLGYATTSTTVTLIGTTPVSVLSKTVTVPSGATVLVLATGTIEPTDANTKSVGHITMDGTGSLSRVGAWSHWMSHSASDEISRTTGHAILTPSAGDHTFHMTVTMLTGAGSVDFLASTTAPGSLVILQVA